MNWPLFISTFSLIFFAELPDKTAMATLLMAARGRALAVFLGVGLAFLIQTLVAVSFGRLIGLLPKSWVHLAAGLLFLGFAVHSWWHLKDPDDAGVEKPLPIAKTFFSATWKAFLVIFIAEWGDLTQLSTASLAATHKEDLPSIFVAALLALWAVAGIAVLVGRKLGHIVHVDLLRKISVGVFGVVGVYFLVTWL